MADHEHDIPEGERPTPVPDPHRDEPAPAPDAHTRSAPDADMVRPDQQEEIGPLEGLAHAAGVQATTEVTDNPEAEAEADRLGIESEGVESAQIFSVMLATAVTLVLAVVGVFFLVAYEASDETVERDAVVLYPELQETRARAAAKIGAYGRQDELYRMPIEAAMESVAEEYYDRQQGGNVTPAPANFSMIYLDANSADRLGLAPVGANDGLLPTQEANADLADGDVDTAAETPLVVEEPEDR